VLHGRAGLRPEDMGGSLETEQGDLKIGWSLEDWLVKGAALNEIDLH
jgi:hypothetical protein